MGAFDPDLAVVGYGVVAGVVSSLPAGPVTVMIIDSTLRLGKRGGVATVAGLIAIELVYVVLFLLGFDAVLTTHPRIFMAFGLCGSLVLLTLGVRALRRSGGPEGARAADGAEAASANAARPMERRAWPELTRDAALVAATNPAILLLFTGVVTTAVSLFTAPRVHAHMTALLLGMEAGAIAWFGLLVAVVSRVRRRLSPGVRRGFDRVAGGVLVGFGLVMPVRLWIGR